MKEHTNTHSLQQLLYNLSRLQILMTEGYDENILSLSKTNKGKNKTINKADINITVQQMRRQIQKMIRSIEDDITEEEKEEELEEFYYNLLNQYISLQVKETKEVSLLNL